MASGQRLLGLYPISGMHRGLHGWRYESNDVFSESFRDLFSEVGVQIDPLVESSLANACEKGRAWEWSLRLAGFAIGRLSGIYNSLMSLLVSKATESSRGACEKSFQWPMALSLLTQMGCYQAGSGTQIQQDRGATWRHQLLHGRAL